MDSLFPNGFPEGTFQYYVENDTRSRETGEEKRLASIDLHEIETSLRKAGEVHKEARSYIQSKSSRRCASGTCAAIWRTRCAR